jgi:NADH dehydrogenase FAD-containing subunit/uncharacterized membrane protein YphA (DoxX/SURF4 family)
MVKLQVSLRGAPMFCFKISDCCMGQVSLVGAGFARMWSPSRNRRGGLHDRGSLAVRNLALALAAVFLFTNTVFAHEQWILTPEQIIELNSKPKPDLYTHWSANNITMIMVFLLFVAGWVRLGYTGAHELFPDLQARLASYGNHVPPILRVCVAWVLLSSAFGAEPRFGVAPFTSPTFVAPDLLLRDLGQNWAWLRWAEVVISVALLFGFYVRFFAAVLIGFTLLGAWLFGSAILSYAGVLIGICIYLVMQGPGSYYVPLPTPRPLLGVQSWLASLPRQRAQAIMRVLTGATILYAGIKFKVLQPNLCIGIITTYHLPLLWRAPESVTLLMTLVEVTAGFLIILGILLRPLSLVLLAAFFFFASFLPESYTSHIMFYGVMLSFLFNAAGHWRLPEARDKAAEIVIVGGGFSAISAATRIEKLIGPYTRVNVTLVHDSPNMLFYPLLPEVISGGMQPGDVVNPIRRIIPSARVLSGQLHYVDDRTKRVGIKRKDGKEIELPYDELILTLFFEPNLDLVPGMITHSHPINSIGDALHIRKRVLERVEDAELADEATERSRLLTFAVVGSGQRSCATAVELCEMLRTAEVSYPVLRDHGWQVHLYEDTKAPFSDFEARVQSQRDRELVKACVKLFRDDEIMGLTDRGITLATGERRPVGMVVNASFKFPTVRLNDQEVAWPLEVGDDLSVKGHASVWAPMVTTDGTLGHFDTTADLVAVGNAIGYNAWARSQNYRSRRFVPRRRFFRSYNMGRRSLCSLGGMIVSGTPAWILSRLTILLALPGLERNLRILIDWILDIPFRNDIAVLAPDQTERMQRKRFEPGDEVISQGDVGDVAYVVESGCLEVLKDGAKVGQVAEGDCFGELALLSGVKRTATVRCLTPCELTVLARNDFQALSSGQGALAKAIRKQAEERGRAGIDAVDESIP